VPEIARFFGIVIRMYVEAGGPHHRPHFHAYYQNGAGVYAIDSAALIANTLRAFAKQRTPLPTGDQLSSRKVP
jgi:hypothetical protein